MTETGARARTNDVEPVDRAARLELARGVLRAVEQRSTTTLGVPTPGAPAERGGKAFPVVAPLASLLPSGGLRRGSTVAVAAGPGATSLLFALLAQVSNEGTWTAVVGRPDLGLVAAAEAGVVLRRLALVPHPGAELVAVTMALLDGIDVVAVAGAGRIRAAERRRLEARARQRGAVLVALGGWGGAEVELSCVGARWGGIEGACGRTGDRWPGHDPVGHDGRERLAPAGGPVPRPERVRDPGSGEQGVPPNGSGRLRERLVRVRATGRGVGPTGREARVLLPAAGGAVVAGETGGVAAGSGVRDAG